MGDVPTIDHLHACLPCSCCGHCCPGACLEEAATARLSHENMRTIAALLVAASALAGVVAGSVRGADFPYDDCDPLVPSMCAYTRRRVERQVQCTWCSSP